MTRSTDRLPRADRVPRRRTKPRLPKALWIATTVVVSLIALLVGIVSRLAGYDIPVDRYPTVAWQMTLWAIVTTALGLLALPRVRRTYGLFLTLAGVGIAVLANATAIFSAAHLTSARSFCYLLMVLLAYPHGFAVALALAGRLFQHVLVSDHATPEGYRSGLRRLIGGEAPPGSPVRAPMAALALRQDLVREARERNRTPRGRRIA